jgi:hypothetical protein
MQTKNKLTLLLVSILFMLVTITCSSSSSPPVESLMPDISGYNTVKTDSVQGYIATLAEEASLLAGQPHLMATIGIIDSMTACYQDKGAVNVQVYSDQVEPLSSGVIAMVDYNRITDPSLLFDCAVFGSADTQIQPCMHEYTLHKDDNKFYIMYAGTTPRICSDFCKNLEGCENSKR